MKYSSEIPLGRLPSYLITAKNVINLEGVTINKETPRLPCWSIQADPSHRAASGEIQRYEDDVSRNDLSGESCPELSCTSDLLIENQLNVYQLYILWKVFIWTESYHQKMVSCISITVSFGMLPGTERCEGLEGDRSPRKISNCWWWLLRELGGGWTTHLKNMLVKLDHFPK